MMRQDGKPLPLPAIGKRPERMQGFIHGAMG